MFTGAEVAATIASIKNLHDLISSMKDSADKRKVSAAFEDTQAKFIDMRSALMETQELLSAANDRATAAEQKSVELEEWKGESSRYIVHEVIPGFFAYTHKPGMENGEPPHSLCANCFANHKKSFVQRNHHPLGYKYECHKCNTSVVVRGR